MSCTPSVEENLAAAERLVRRAAGEGAQIVLLPELFERPYFCQERRYEYYAYAKPTLENDAVRHFLPISKELSLVLPISFYERSGNVLYNSVAVLDCGVLLGVYRKTHIPDDHYYQEKFYFTPGDTGFRVWNTTYGKVGVGICWDQWFPETARCLALGRRGAAFLSHSHRQRADPGRGQHAPLAAHHAGARGGQCRAGDRGQPLRPGDRDALLRKRKPVSSLNFYGSSFLTDATGAVIAQAERTGEAVLTAKYDLDELFTERLSWGLFRDRRPDCYRTISAPTP